MCVAALVLDAAAAVGNSPVQMPPYVAAPPEPQRRPDPTYALRPHLTTPPKKRN